MFRACLTVHTLPRPSFTQVMQATYSFNLGRDRSRLPPAAPLPVGRADAYRDAGSDSSKGLNGEVRSGGPGELPKPTTATARGGVAPPSSLAAAAGAPEAGVPTERDALLLQECDPADASTVLYCAQASGRRPGWPTEGGKGIE